MAVWLERFLINSSQSTCQLTAPPLLSLPLLLSLRSVIVLGALSTVMVVERWLGYNLLEMGLYYNRILYSYLRMRGETFY